MMPGLMRLSLDALLSKLIFLAVFSMMQLYRSVAAIFGVLPVAPATADAGGALLRRTYDSTAWWYDLLDYPWERIYRNWRPLLAGDLTGNVLDLGVGTGRNLAFFPAVARVVGLDISPVSS